MAIAALLRPHATLSSLRTTSASRERRHRSPSLSQPPFSSPSRTPLPPTTPELQGRLLEDSSLHAGSPLLLHPSDQKSGRPSREEWKVIQNASEVPQQITQSAAVLQLQKSVSETEHLMMTSSGVSVLATPRYALMFATFSFRFRGTDVVD